MNSWEVTYRRLGDETPRVLVVEAISNYSARREALWLIGSRSTILRIDLDARPTTTTPTRSTTQGANR